MTQNPNPKIISHNFVAQLTTPPPPPPGMINAAKSMVMVGDEVVRCKSS